MIAPRTAPPSGDRRRARRRQPTVGTICQLLATSEANYEGLVWNISTTGVSMLIHQRLEPGTTIPIELSTADLSSILQVTLRVAHVTRLRTGDYFLGGQFLRTVTPQEFEPFLMRSHRSGSGGKPS